jgi:hypothetical protein
MLASFLCKRSGFPSWFVNLFLTIRLLSFSAAIKELLQRISYNREAREVWINGNVFVLIHDTITIDWGINPAFPVLLFMSFRTAPSDTGHFVRYKPIDYPRCIRSRPHDWTIAIPKTFWSPINVYPLRRCEECRFVYHAMCRCCRCIIQPACFDSARPCEFSRSLDWKYEHVEDEKHWTTMIRVIPIEKSRSERLYMLFYRRHHDGTNQYDLDESCLTNRGVCDRYLALRCDVRGFHLHARPGLVNIMDMAAARRIRASRAQAASLRRSTILPGWWYLVMSGALRLDRDSILPPWWHIVISEHH